MTWTGPPADPGWVPTAPGWYPDAYGWRWWDGVAWSPYVPASPQVGATNSRQTAMWAWLGALLVNIASTAFGWVVPLVMYTSNKQDRFIRHHASESLNLQLSLLILLVVSYVGFFVSAIALIPATASSDATSGAVIVLVVFGVLGVAVLAAGITALVWMILGAVRANRGEWWTVPFCIRFVKGRVPVEEQYPA